MAFDEANNTVQKLASAAAINARFTKIQALLLAKVAPKRLKGNFVLKTLKKFKMPDDPA